MTSSWPDILPVPSVNGYNYEPQIATIRTEMEIGAKVRRRFTRHPTFIDVLWTFSKKQQEIFDAWFVYIIDDGSKWFQINLPTGQEIKLYNARFIGTYKVSAYKNLYWNVQAKLEIEGLAIFTEEELLSQLLNLSDIYSIHEIIHSNYPAAVGII